MSFLQFCYVCLKLVSAVWVGFYRRRWCRCKISVDFISFNCDATPPYAFHSSLALRCSFPALYSLYKEIIWKESRMNLHENYGAMNVLFILHSREHDINRVKNEPDLQSLKTSWNSPSTSFFFGIIVLAHTSFISGWVEWDCRVEKRSLHCHRNPLRFKANYIRRFISIYTEAPRRV